MLLRKFSGFKVGWSRRFGTKRKLRRRDSTGIKVGSLVIGQLFGGGRSGLFG